MDAAISVNKAIVTQASSAIPVVPLYISLLYKIMKQMNLHEGSIEQMIRMFKKLEKMPRIDEDFIFMDDWEMREDVQKEVKNVWRILDDGNLDEYLDLEGYNRDFMQIFGFQVEGVDYAKDQDENILIEDAVIL